MRFSLSSRVSRTIGVLFVVMGLALGPAATGQPGLAPAAYADTTVAGQPDAQPDVAAVQQDVEAVHRAFDLLLDEYVHPLGSDVLLRAAWEQIDQEATQRHAPLPASLPPLAGERAADFGAFQRAFLEYAGQPGSLPTGFVPAYAAVRGMAAAVNERHTYFLDPSDYQQYLVWRRGDEEYAGVGIRFKGQAATVVEVIENTPAARAGVQAGDMLVRINGTSIAGLSADDTAGLLRGPEKTPVDLVVQRLGRPEPVTLHMERERVVVEPVVQRMLGGGAGYVRLRGFPTLAAVETLERDVAALQQQGAHGWVLDLRGNQGGRLDAGARLLGHFLPAGTPLFTEIDGGGQQETFVAAPSDPYTLPLVVLVDGVTASTGEIFAAAIQEHGVAPVLGSTTAGRVAGARIFPLGNGTGLQVTDREIVSSLGQTLNGVGVVPDEEVTADLPTGVPGQDAAVDRALAILLQHAPLAP